jgi:hypothetical protein
MKRLYVLVRHLDSGPGVNTLNVAGGRFERITQDQSGTRMIEQCRSLFPSGYARYSDWIYKRTYSMTPPARSGGDASGFGDIPYRVEDLLLALRLLRPGDVSFVAQATVGDDGTTWLQQPYRYFGAIASTHPYHLDAADIPAVDDLLKLVMRRPPDSTWFSVAKRFFLYGGGKEFNPYTGELDRIVDLVVALEAVLVFEKDFVGRLLRNRAIRLLGLEGDAAKPVKTMLSDFYGYRSTIAHGDQLPIDNPAETHRQMWTRISDLVVVSCAAEQTSGLDFPGSDARNPATKGDTPWVRKNPSPFSSPSTAF